MSQANDASTAGYAFQGREWDAETSLLYMRARYYDAAAGVWTSEDPIGFGGGANFSQFANNNPVRFVDPLGLCGDDQASGPSGAAAASGGALTGGGGTLVAVLSSSATRVGADGQVRILDLAAAQARQGARQFHLDPSPTPHFNADLGLLARFNHDPISPSTLVYGSEAFLKSVSRITLVGGLAIDAVIVNTAPANQLGAAYGGVLGGWSGAFGLAAVGTAMGGPLGGVIGGLVGGFGGGWVGSMVGNRIQNGR